ncbi:hypothetical protein A4U94_14490 [Prescottella equi]|uniref:GNAT family N-acetyltransferase n=1 Tax=Rhodococcus hoagii TaxID=43767 RepID=UPI0009BD4B48|nr:GNAT family N-acetyltransferase [Prescottella equi]OQQ21539.1 hypothetical protein A4U94_14490 [Prescottella equi]
MSSFKTGLESVDDWFCNKALHAQKAGQARTHVCLSVETEIVAFFALKNIIVNLEGSTKTMQRIAEFKVEDAAGATTGLLIAQMGVRSGLQGAGMGKGVVRHVMKVASELHKQSTFHLLVVDAENTDLIPYYGKFGFRQLKNDLRMVMKMSAVHKVVEGLA